jgi:Ca2+-binding EF-hand superfamily protein
MSTLGELEVAFKNADGNGDSLLDVAELAKAQGLTEVQAQSLIDYFAAGDSMTFSEYIVMTKVLKSDVSGVFKLWDKDKSGILDPKELEDLKTAMKLTDEQWKDILERVDLDKDGKIDAKEFVLLCQTLNKKDALPPKKVKKAKEGEAAAAAGGDASNGNGVVVIAVLALVVGGFLAYKNGAFDKFLKPAQKK